MKTKKVIAGKNLSMRCPLIATLVFWMALDHWSAPGWAWGAVGLILVLGWIAWIVDVVWSEQVEIFETKPRPE